MKKTKIVCEWVALHRSKAKKTFFIENTRNSIFVANDGLVVVRGEEGGLPPRGQRSKVKKPHLIQPLQNVDDSCSCIRLRHPSN